MAALSRIKPGQVLYDYHRERAGNTTMYRTGCCPVYVREVRDNGAIVSWNGNPARFWSEKSLKKLKVKKREK